MLQTFYKPMVVLPTFILLIITSLSANKTMFSTAAQFNQEQKSYAIQFQNFRGINRIGEFNHLKEIVDEAATKGYTKADIVKILGTPNHQSSKQLQYWLQEAANKAIVIINLYETIEQVIGCGVINNENQCTYTKHYKHQIMVKPYISLRNELFRHINYGIKMVYDTKYIDYSLLISPSVHL